MRIAAAQTPDYQDDKEGALAWAAAAVAQAADAGARMLCFPEAYLQGYLTAPEAARRVAIAVDSDEFRMVAARLAAPGLKVILGLIEQDGTVFYNTAVVLEDGAVLGRYRKAHLLAGEHVFAAGTAPAVFEVGTISFGINICFDTNFPEAAAQVRDRGAALLVCPANNMMPRAQAALWRDRHNEIRAARCWETGMWLLSADVTGERDGRVSWGPTAVLNPAGHIMAQLPLDNPGLLLFDLPISAASPC